MNIQHPRDPLHGVKLTTILEELLAYYGWDGLGDRIPVRCFTMNPSINSSLKFLRKTPWAREKVEALYLNYLSAKEFDTEGGQPVFEAPPPRGFFPNRGRRV